MRYLLIPENNSLSHVAKCLAIREVLLGKDHDVLIAVNRKHSLFLYRIGVDCHILPDIQEIDGAAFPTTLWFKHPQRFIACVQEEVALLKNYKPDRILGIFRFTSKASAQIAGIPFDSLICGCMLPDSAAVLGFAVGETGIDLQKENLKGFFQYAAAKTSTALVSLGLDKIKDIRCMLKGDRTFLWDFPEFFPIKPDKTTTHVGPIFNSQWPSDSIGFEWPNNSKNPLAVITFGTCTISPPVAERMTSVLLKMGYDVLIAAGGSRKGCASSLGNHGLCFIVSPPFIKFCRTPPCSFVMAVK